MRVAMYSSDPQGLRQILDLWLDCGSDLGNHSHSHLNINNVPVEEYTLDIVKGEPILRAALAWRGKKLEFYRHPFLFIGPTAEIKKGIQKFVDQQGGSRRGIYRWGAGWG